MAVPMPVPNAMGGNRQFIADANDTNISSAVGDMAALNLQLIHCLRATIDDGANGAAHRLTVDRIADDLKKAIYNYDIKK